MLNSQLQSIGNSYLLQAQNGSSAGVGNTNPASVRCSERHKHHIPAMWLHYGLTSSALSSSAKSEVSRSIVTPSTFLCGTAIEINPPPSTYSLRPAPRSPGRFSIPIVRQCVMFTCMSMVAYVSPLPGS